MGMREMTRFEWKMWPDRENATLRVQGSAVGSYDAYPLEATGGAIKKRALTYKELAASAGVYLNSDRAWLIPDENLPDEIKPKAGDQVRDAAGIDWTIGEVMVGKFGNTHKCIARALAIVESLRDTGTHKRPASAKDSAGRPALATTATLATVYCRLQPEDSDAAESFDQVGMPSVFTAFLAEPITVQAHDQFIVSGVTYTIRGFRNPSRIWDLMSLKLELR